jgi:hypothetical protein
MEPLADRLGLTPGVLALYIAGKAPVPEDVFFAAIDIVTEASVRDAAKPAVKKGEAKPVKTEARGRHQNS